MTIKFFAEKEILSRSLLTKEKKAFIMRIGMPKLVPDTKHSFYACHIDYGWLGDKMDPRVRRAAEQGAGLNSVDALQDAISKEYRLPMYVKGYAFSHCDDSYFLTPRGDLRQFMNISDVVKMTNKGQDTIYAWAELYFFPAPIRSGPHAGKFRAEEVQLWCDDPSHWQDNAELLAVCKNCQHFLKL